MSQTIYMQVDERESLNWKATRTQDLYNNGRVCWKCSAKWNATYEPKSIDRFDADVERRTNTIYN